MFPNLTALHLDTPSIEGKRKSDSLTDYVLQPVVRTVRKSMLKLGYETPEFQALVRAITDAAEARVRKEPEIECALGKGTSSRVLSQKQKDDLAAFWKGVASLLEATGVWVPQFTARFATTLPSALSSANASQLLRRFLIICEEKSATATAKEGYLTTSPYRLAIQTAEQLLESAEMKRLVDAAVESLLDDLKAIVLPGTTIRNMMISVVLQKLQPNYEAIAPVIHMDNARRVIFDHRDGGQLVRGARYGFGSDQNDDLFVTSFCINERGTPSACGTYYYDGVPVVSPDVLHEYAAFARDVDPTNGIFNCTDTELIDAIGTEINQATVQVLGGDEDRLLDAGVVVRRAPPLKWSNLNSYAFHRSPTIDEVPQNGGRLFAGVSFNRNSVDDSSPLQSEAERKFEHSSGVAVTATAYVDPQAFRFRFR